MTGPYNQPPSGGWDGNNPGGQNYPGQGGGYGYDPTNPGYTPPVDPNQQQYPAPDQGFGQPAPDNQYGFDQQYQQPQQQYQQFGQQGFEPPKSGMSTGLLVAIIAAVIVVLGGGIAGAVVLLGDDDDSDDSSGKGDEKKSSKSTDPSEEEPSEDDPGNTTSTGDFIPSGANYSADVPKGFDVLDSKPSEVLMSSDEIGCAGLDGDEAEAVCIGHITYPDAETDGYDTWKDIWASSNPEELSLPKGKGFKVDSSVINTITWYIFYDDQIIEIVVAWENEESDVKKAGDDVLDSLELK